MKASTLLTEEHKLKFVNLAGVRILEGAVRTRGMMQIIAYG